MNLKDGQYVSIMYELNAYIFKGKVIRLINSELSYCADDSILSNLVNLDRIELTKQDKKMLKWFIKSNYDRMSVEQAKLGLTDEQMTETVECYSISTKDTSWFAYEVEQSSDDSFKFTKFVDLNTKEAYQTSDVSYLSVKKVKIAKYINKIREKVRVTYPC